MTRRPAKVEESVRSDIRAADVTADGNRSLGGANI